MRIAIRKLTLILIFWTRITGIQKFNKLYAIMNLKFSDAILVMCIDTGFFHRFDWNIHILIF